MSFMGIDNFPIILITLVIIIIRKLTFFFKSCAYYKIFYSKKWIYYEQIDIKFDLPFYETMQFDSFICNMIFG